MVARIRVAIASSSDAPAALSRPWPVQASLWNERLEELDEIAGWVFDEDLSSANRLACPLQKAAVFQLSGDPILDEGMNPIPGQKDAHTHRNIFVKQDAQAGDSWRTSK
jgi:hypothetical protein